jgi:hypothetical protein
MVMEMEMGPTSFITITSLHRRALRRTRRRLQVHVIHIIHICIAVDVYAETNAFTRLRSSTAMLQTTPRRGMQQLKRRDFDVDFDTSEGLAGASARLIRCTGCDCILLHHILCLVLGF